MPFSVKKSFNYKNGASYDNLSAFFLGDIGEAVTGWMEQNNPVGYTSPELFGAVGDGVADDTQAWKDCIASGKIIVATKNYLCSEPLYLDNDTYIFGKVINDTTDGIKISGKSHHTYVVKVVAQRENAQHLFTGVEILNSSECLIDCEITNYYYGLKLNGSSSGVAYNRVPHCSITNAMYSIYLTASDTGWCNENYFYNMRGTCWSNTLYSGIFDGITLDKANPQINGINSNHFINMCFEGSHCAVNVVNGLDNSFENIRTEGCTYAAMFGVNTTRNVVWFLHGATTYVDESTQTVKNAVITATDIVTKFAE